MSRVILVIIVLILTGCTSQDTIKIGWVSDVTGPVAKYGALEAGLLAVEEINAAGGINGKQIELIVEDGQCNSAEATKAAQKLIMIDEVKFILGGHCSPESIAIAPIAERNGVLLLASITTSPAYSNLGELVVRTSPISTIQSELMAAHAESLGLKKMGVLYEQTDYAQPIGEAMVKAFDGEVVVESYVPGTKDFKAELLKIHEARVDALMLSVQSPDAALIIMKQIEELEIDAQLFGNDVFVIQVAVDELPELYEGTIFALPKFDPVSDFALRYEERYGSTPPYGVWTAESYDAVYLLAQAIEEVGEDPQAVSRYLRETVYTGASGVIDINEEGDGEREYFLGIVKDGKKVPI